MQYEDMYPNINNSNNNTGKKPKIISILEKLGHQSHLERIGKVNVTNKDMMLAITEDTGKFLNILLTAIKANSVLEIGTSAGYSTLWFALALIQNNDGKAPKTENN